ncbi:MAG: YfaZ family outer membrane protein [Gammaproteobacteria bacterium]|nr:YfaZ family outer membrane protein [Gammaproteobacteria bacterium]
MLKRVIFTVSLLTCTAVSASSLDISLSSKTANFQFLSDASALGSGGADIGVGVFYDDSSNYMANANILVLGHPASERLPVQLGVGAKAYVASLDGSDESVAAVGLGGMARYVVPAEIPVALSLEAYFAPAITSFGDTEEVVQIDARVEVNVMPSARAYLGYRYLNTRLKLAGDVTLDDRLHVGIRLNF